MMSNVNLVTSRVNLMTSRVYLMTSRDTLVLLHIVRPLSVSFHLQNGACSFNRLEVIGEEELCLVRWSRTGIFQPVRGLVIYKDNQLDYLTKLHI